MEPCFYLKYVLDGVLVVRARVARRPFFFCIGPQAGVLHSLSICHEQNDVLGFHMRYEHYAIMVD